MSWLPIETAPKDGTAILAKSDLYQLPFVVYWSSRYEEQGGGPALPENSGIQRDWLLSCSENSELPNYDPTHWMPLVVT